ncbi:HAMP domain-containing histidine kinase [Coriobacteriia bacterium Es71-Z0120]|uniref:sensor histidine kinase n=1 Tax=Parvivirga hydrogeniphila TaxID=2939460 RepID=UPI002260B0F4|nr:HAMP domain-containing sensor histidine kinase [Parvivirga hydrogeniphila]MCL4078336.1 HAMP domain-containing histidine kinase [Parvivirga hydrogeniphila]
MRLKSIRARVLYLAAVFAALLVGSVTLATYFVVSQSMDASARETCSHIASFAAAAAQRLEGSSDAGAGAAGTEAGALQRALEPVTALFDGTQVTLWAAPGAGGGFREAWSNAPGARLRSPADADRALASGKTVQVKVGGGRFLAGFLSRADLGLWIAYVPVQASDGGRAIIEIVHDPVCQESVLDGARAPMVAVGLLATAIAILMMQIVMGWVLSLVDQVRRAADSIDAGQLDVRLPEEGEHEIAELAKSLNALIDRLRKRAEAQTRFVADASHELATPVAGIRGYVNILRAWGAEDPEMRDEAIAAIDRESRRMAKLCSDLLSMIRSEEILEFKHVRYDINAVAREVLANAATRYIDKHLEFLGPEEGPLALWGDPDRIEEALGILVDNACKYTPAGGRVQVSTRRHKDRIIVEVSDTGIGIPEEDLPNIFERFYRSDASRSKETGGFGLGLSIAKHIVDASGGMIWARSKLGSGTTFIISLPRNKQKGANE